MPVNISTAIITKNNNKVRLANLTNKQGSAVQSPASTIKSSDICATAIKTLLGGFSNSNKFSSHTGIALEKWPTNM